MSTNWPADVNPAPKLLVLPPGDVDLGEAEAAIELWEHYSHKTLDDTQRLAVYVMMAQSGPDRWAASTTGREMPRQNGKGDEVEVVELWGLVQRAEAILHTVHDAVLLASQTQQRMLGVLEGHADLSRKVKRKWQGTGQQMIELRNGGIIWYRTRTGGGGRGVDDIDRLVVDEAQHATEEQLAAVSPTLFANPNPQLNAMGTAGLDKYSRWWWSVRKRALSPDPGAFGYIGHTAESVHLGDDGQVVQEPVDAADRSLWAACNPALASGRGGGMDFLEEQYRRLPASFAREHLCVWDPPPPDESSRWEVFSEAEWQAIATAETAKRSERPGWITDEVYAVAMPATRETIAVGAAGPCREDGVGVEVVAYNPAGPWLIGFLQERNVTRVAVDRKGPAGNLADDIEEAGIEVVDVKYDDLKKATGDFYDAVIAGDVVHRNRPELDAAVGNASWRAAGDTRLIERRGEVDVAPLEVVLLAHWLLSNQPSEEVPDLW